VLEVLLDKNAYEPVDTMNISFNIEVNHELSGILKGWLYTPSGVYMDLFEINNNFVAGENKINVSTNLNAALDGLHRVVYALYKIDSLLTLVSGAEAFDVKQAAITSLTTDKKTYSETEPVIAKVGTFATREYAGQIDLLLNGSLKASQGVTLVGGEEVNFDLGLLTAGEYTLVARLHADEVISERQVAFNVSDVAAPAKPTGFSLRVEGSIVILSWNANTEADLAGYNVYRNGVKINAVHLRGIAYRDEGIASGIEYRYYVTAVDDADNESDPSEERSTTLDNTPPIITISPSTDVTASVPISAIYSATDNLDPSPIITANYPSPTTFNKNGVYTVIVEAEDHSGNKASKSITITLTGLNEPPTINLISPIGGEVWSGVRNITWDATDPDGDPLSISIEYSPDGAGTWLTLATGEVNDGVYSWDTTTVPDGTNYLIRVTANDGKLSAKDQSDAVFIIRNNLPPAANAGPNQNVITNELVTLNGSESYDPEGAMITFLWTFIEVPVDSTVTDSSLSDATSAKPTFTPDEDGTYRLELIVNDGALDSVPDEVVIIATTPNVAPNANAGPDQNVYTGQTVYLDGSGSNDPDNGPQPLSYLWSFVGVPQGCLLSDNDISNRNMLLASFVPDVDGTYMIKLTVSDSELASTDDVVLISTTPNVPPNANAGADITITFGQTAILNGSASNDPDNGPDALSYRWRFVSVPAGSLLSNDNISGADTVSPSFTPDISGTYVIELMVSDGIEAAYDNVAITVIVQTYRISGGAYNFPQTTTYKASFSMDVTGPSSPSGWLKYYYSRTRMNFVSTGITEVSVSGNTATIRGTGTVNGVSGYTFTATVSDGSPDNFGITIKKSDGSVYYSAGPGNTSGGDLIILLL
jgi:hypothetical protein